MKKNILTALFITMLGTATSVAQDSVPKPKLEYMPEIHGTIRAKYEYEPTIDKSRFEINNARVSVDGKVLSIAKQVGNVRDVGAVVGWTTPTKVPLTLQADVFNGSVPVRRHVDDEMIELAPE